MYKYDVAVPMATRLIGKSSRLAALGLTTSFFTPMNTIWMMMWKNPRLFVTQPHRLHIALFLRLSHPGRLMSFLVLTYLGFLLFHKEPKLPWEPSVVTTLLYITTFATHFGTQIWMTFISGIVLFFSLPRKIFGMVQRHLFPKYFLLNSVFGFITLLTFILHNPTLESELGLQKWALTICLLCDLISHLYIVPDMVSTMQVRSAMEEEAGVGQESGRHDPGKLKNNPQYVQLHRRFRRFHGACAIANLIAMSCNSVHMYHLAKKLCDVL